MGVQSDGSRGGEVARLLVVDGPSGRRQRTQGERARIAAQSLIPGASVADVARRYGVTRWQVCDWPKKLRTGRLVVPGTVAALPMFADLVVENGPVEGPPSVAKATSEAVTERREVNRGDEEFREQLAGQDRLVLAGAGSGTICVITAKDADLIKADT